ncbi:MAG: hypothetical protein ACM3UZ_16660 [Acidobacteriota bacterium]
MSKNEGIFISVITLALIILGFYAVWIINWWAAVISIVMAGLMWYGWHQVRVCSHCNQECPYRTKRQPKPGSQVGFTKNEAIVFILVFGIIVIAYISAVFKLNFFAGAILLVLLGYAGVIYRRKVCPSCTIPCPVNPNGIR